MSGPRALRRVLVANRGEIAARVIGTCRRLGIETVLTTSDADAESVPARLADKVIRIGPAAAAASYLDVDAVVGAAVFAGADAIHPGYGFLSENARLARACAAAGIVFAGPDPRTLEAAGDKLAAREHAATAGLPVLPGGDISGDGAALATRIGYPVLVKAAGGGGGRGLRVVRSPAELGQAVSLASAEAAAAFADPRVYLERYVERGRHVEVQILGDGERVIHLGDRGAGTVEFLVDTARGEFYFLEINARIQVEHPVTEAITGLDIVAEQLAIAEGRPLRVTQADVTFAGHAIECRINAEDPDHDFRPSPGTVTRAVFPAGTGGGIRGGGGIRVDTHVQAGSTVPPYYDSLLAKVIAHGHDRIGALAVLSGALDRCAIDGVTTNLGMQRALIADPEFAAGGVTTDYLARWLAAASGHGGGRG